MGAGGRDEPGAGRGAAVRLERHAARDGRALARWGVLAKRANQQKKGAAQQGVAAAAGGAGLMPSTTTEPTVRGVGV